MINRKYINLILVIITFFVTPAAWATKSKFPIQHWVTAKGIRVYFLPVNNLPIIDIKLAFAAGAARDGDKYGIATLTNELLNEGTSTKDADAIASSFEKYGAIYNSSVARDMAVVSLRSLSNNELLAPSLEIFKDVISNPSFPKREFNRERNNQLAAISQELQSPSDVATRRFYKTLYGKHPYGNPILGTAESLTKLEITDVRNFYNSYYSAQNATLAIVGDIDRAKAESIANLLSKDMNLGRAAPAFEDMPPLAEEKILNIPFPSNQTNIKLGQLGITRKSRDYFPLMIGNYTLGGGSLVSRIFDEVREKRGLSYSAYSRFIPMAAKGPFVISLGTRNNQAQQAIQVTQNVLQNFVKNGPSVKEVKAAKQHINGNFALQLDSNSKLVDNILSIGFYDLPLNYLDTYQGKVKAVTRAQIKKAFQRNLHLNKMVLISVGEKMSEETKTTDAS